MIGKGGPRGGMAPHNTVMGSNTYYLESKE